MASSRDGDRAPDNGGNGVYPAGYCTHKAKFPAPNTAIWCCCPLPGEHPPASSSLSSELSQPRAHRIWRNMWLAFGVKLFHQTGVDGVEA
ncbi:hypothetical protein J7T55_010217 [Diaporthe amygdali]|uniref:uncharacterized protein n=1 Tax=Phomopsis amygdali TaxID=1214568 RepID=UPI0022FE2059|nr:uncharacterized protein J7T55_010217 [Diaporthe amygdali]KAJ0113973.1 hypothetical protein J7T55_010217 [Diaporthe amygdali]